MRRVLYNTSIADPFLWVAQKLKEEQGFNPVYWIGFNYDHSDDLVPSTFPDICYQSYGDAWRGVFNESVQIKSTECYLDIDLLNKLSRYELQAIKMMDRMDFDRYSFNFMERERHYLNLIKSWMAVFELYKIDLVISATNPHRVYDYVLYLLCKEKHIPFVILQYSLCPEWTWLNKNIYSLGDKFDKDYQKYLSKGNLSKDDLPMEIKREYEKVTKDYSVAVPYYMSNHKKESVRYSGFFSLARVYLKKYGLFGKNGLLSRRKVPALMRKRRGYSLESGSNGLFESMSQQLNKVKYCKAMLRFYQSLTVMPKEGVKFILFALNYQPEETSSPSGDIFVNQLLCVETLLKNTPEDVFIYVKEHPSEYMFHNLGQTSRIKEFYLDLLKSSRVKLMPMELNTYSLMKNAMAVATVTGTVGWEAIMHRKPVIVFGIIWYERMPGVLRITDSKSALQIYNFIQNYVYDEQKILAYLMAFSSNGFKCYQYDGIKELTNMDREECVENIAKAIVESINTIE